MGGDKGQALVSSVLLPFGPAQVGGGKEKLWGEGRGWELGWCLQRVSVDCCLLSVAFRVLDDFSQF